MNINTKAEMGKSYFIAVLFRVLNKLVAIASKLLLLVRATFTSVVVFNINSQTIYNLLKLLIQYLFRDLLFISFIPL